VNCLPEDQHGVEVTLYRSASDLVVDDVFLEMNSLIDGINLILKIECFNPAGSIKLKTAVSLLDDAEWRGLLRPGGCVIESSSGNLGIALSSICAIRGYRFICVTDPNTSPQSIVLMRVFGASVVEVTERDTKGGYLQTRINYIKKRVETDTDLFWPNQYANPANPAAHCQRTADAIAKEVQDLDYLFIGTGTGGTLMGCARYFRAHSPRTKIIAVDAEGSATFGFPPGRRQIPGLGTSRKPEIVEPGLVDDIVVVPEGDAIRMCRLVAAKFGIAVGGSTGSVLAAITRSRSALPFGANVVAISPDSGDRYLDTIYDDKWVEERFGPTVLGRCDA
jgi:N-(2-amino-2-carboxyethyl)-L-glutamate synthase